MRGWLVVKIAIKRNKILLTYYYNFQHIVFKKPDIKRVNIFHLFIKKFLLIIEIYLN